jgi:hypothetical protein
MSTYYTPKESADKVPFAYLNRNKVLSPFRERPLGPVGTMGEIQRDFYSALHFFNGIND